jgi:hypothetical protein
MAVLESRILWNFCHLCQLGNQTSSFVMTKVNDLRFTTLLSLFRLDVYMFMSKPTLADPLFTSLQGSLDVYHQYSFACLGLNAV